MGSSPAKGPYGLFYFVWTVIGLDLCRYPGGPTRSMGLSPRSSSATHQPKKRFNERRRTETVAGLVPFWWIEESRRWMWVRFTVARLGTSRPRAKPDSIRRLSHRS
jgi:hypothetical protein